MKNTITIALLWAISLLISTAHANITYVVNRTIDQGTVTGFIETDGTLGVLNSANIIDWELTLTAPNLVGGSPDVIDFATQSQTILDGSVTTATATDILFDISGGSGEGFFLLHGGGPDNYWCIETAIANCTGIVGEHIGRDTVSGGNAQTALPTGTFSIASVAVPCQADLNGDGDLNFIDVSQFLLAYGAGDPVADFSGDGVFNFLDVSSFLIAYGAGCP
jgi:hypothetical protein